MATSDRDHSNRFYILSLVLCASMRERERWVCGVLVNQGVSYTWYRSTIEIHEELFQFFRFVFSRFNCNECMKISIDYCLFVGYDSELLTTETKWLCVLFFVVSFWKVNNDIAQMREMREPIAVAFVALLCVFEHVVFFYIFLSFLFFFYVFVVDAIVLLSLTHKTIWMHWHNKKILLAKRNVKSLHR